jgi:hypothetical protein
MPPGPLIASASFEQTSGVMLMMRSSTPKPAAFPRIVVRISGDREHGFQTIVSSYFAGS